MQVDDNLKYYDFVRYENKAMVMLPPELMIVYILSYFYLMLCYTLLTIVYDLNFLND